MALTTTATSSVMAHLKQLLGDPLCEISSVNKTKINITYQVFAYNVTNMTSKEDVQLLFDVLAGKRELREVVALCTKSSVLESYM